MFNKVLEKIFSKNLIWLPYVDTSGFRDGVLNLLVRVEPNVEE